MQLDECFERAVAALRSAGIPFAVAGGFAASLYRFEPRLTMDVDFAVGEGADLSGATRLLEALGLKTGVVREADFAGGPLFAIRRQNTPPVMVVGTPVLEEEAGAVDILLPSIPWVKEAVNRAQSNLVDFGFGAVSVLTLEDLLISKLYALSRKMRLKDLDDLASIFAQNPALDWTYLETGLHHAQVRLPPSTRRLLPGPLQVLLQ